jgi:PPOX class probable FMN-dependent enzyme
MPEWVSELREALSVGLGNEPWIATLATVDRVGHPHARCVVVRRIDDDGTMTLVTDARSGKACQARHVPIVQLVTWLPGLRTQYRITARADLISPTDSDPIRLQLWTSLSDETRATFFWPPPGRLRESASEGFPLAVTSDVEPPLEFEVMRLEPERVDRLMLNTLPHTRTEWFADGVWQSRALNP